LDESNPYDLAVGVLIGLTALAWIIWQLLKRGGGNGDKDG
jgi:hypothetical protein